MRARIFSWLGWILLIGLTTPALAESKLAFVVGIDAYPHLGAEAQLERAVADANAVGDALESLGFGVTRVTQDATLDTILNAFAKFTSTIQPGDTVVFYYAGHGVSLDDGNYLIPADVPLLGPSDERLAKHKTIPERDFSQDIRNSGARVAIMVIDACRNNPFPPKGTRALGGATRGFARMAQPEGMFTLYSAREGQAAIDRLSGADNDANSVFTRVFLKELKSPGVNLSELGDRVRDEVSALAHADGQDQVPAVYNDLLNSRSVYLAGPPAAALGLAPVERTSTPDSCVAASDHWKSAEAIGSVAAFEDHLSRFPNCVFAGLAKARIESLKGRVAVVTPPESPHTGPIGYWPLDRDATNWTTRTTRDVSGNSNTGALVDISAAAGGALKFNGTSSVIKVSSPTKIPIGNSNYAISLWFNAAYVGAPEGLVGWGNYGALNQVNALRFVRRGEPPCPGVGLVNYWWSNDLFACTNITPNAWHHAIAEFDGTTRRIYLDDTLIASDTPQGHNVPNADHFKIGEACPVGIFQNYPGEFFPGIIEKVRVYDRALTTEEIDKLWAAGH